MRLGLLKRSFIPEVAQRDLRDITGIAPACSARRLRRQPSAEILEDANIKLASVASDVQGVSARAMLEALIQGETDAAVLAAWPWAGCAANCLSWRRRCRPDPGTSPLHVRQLLHHLDTLNQELATLDAQIRVSPHPRRPSSSGWMPYRALIAARPRSSWPRLARM